MRKLAAAQDIKNHTRREITFIESYCRLVGNSMIYGSHAAVVCSFRQACSTGLRPTGQTSQAY